MLAYFKCPCGCGTVFEIHCEHGAVLQILAEERPPVKAIQLVRTREEAKKA
jgi:hypothetical protein